MQPFLDFKLVILVVFDTVKSKLQYVLYQCEKSLNLKKLHLQLFRMNLTKKISFTIVQQSALRCTKSKCDPCDSLSHTSNVVFCPNFGVILCSCFP